jgi:polyhydroxyalkanoate synthesis regulator protein
MARRNMEMFERAFAMFAPFPRREAQPGTPGPEAGKAPPPEGGEIDDLKKQMDEMQRRLDRLTDKGK